MHRLWGRRCRARRSAARRNALPNKSRPAYNAGMPSGIRILLLADSHLGFDLPTRPRVDRRRRGYDFLANYSTALAPALNREVDLVVHAGDVFDRSSVVPSLAYQAFQPLRRVAELGVPVFIVPGNHERSRLPHIRFATHPCVHVFDSPRTFVVSVRGTSIALSGFPYERRDVRTQFTTLLEQSSWRDTRADVRVLCMHHCVEGATVGPADYTFTLAKDVIRTRDIPREFAAVLSGHIHRHQVLTTDLSQRRLPAPILYPGSIERTSFAEMDEPKGFMLVDVNESEGDWDVRWEFRRLPARPMIQRELAVNEMDVASLESAIQRIVTEAPPDAVLAIRLSGQVSDDQWRVLSAPRLRELAPASMNVEISLAGGARQRVPEDLLTPLLYHY